MPLSPQRRRQLRAMDERKYPRKRCANCPRFFEQGIKQTVLLDACRKEYFHYGAAFGPLKEKLEALVSQWLREHGVKLETRLQKLERDLADIRDPIAAEEKRNAR